MDRFGRRILAIAVWASACGVPVHALERTYVASGDGSSMEYSWAVLTTDSNGSPVVFVPSAVQVDVNVPGGSDTAYWSYVVDTVHVAGTACPSCPKDHHEIEYMTNDSALFASIPTWGVVSDTQWVTINGASYEYLRYATNGPQGRSTVGNFFDLTYLKGVGPVFYQSGSLSSGTAGYRYHRFSLASFNDISLDTLWGKTLYPLAIFPSARRAEPRFAPRKFDLHEMGIFLGRKSALKEPLPKAR